MPASHSPVICAWELGIRLRERREQAGITATAAAKKTRCTQGFLSSIELGRPKLTADRLAQLCTLYDIDTDETAELEDLRQRSNEKAWWHRYSGLFSSELQRYFGYEAGAEQIRSYHSEVVHGLLQTEEYAHAVIAGGSPYIRLTEVDRRVEARMLRQERLSGPDRTQLTCLLSQGALCHQIGGRRVMRNQLWHLADLSSQSDNVEIRVIPFHAGAHPAIGGPFEILSFASPRLHDVVWQEILTSTDIVPASKVTEYLVSFAEAARSALSQADSIELIRQVGKELE